MRRERLSMSPPPRCDDHMRISEERLSQDRLSEEPHFQEKIDEISSDMPSAETSLQRDRSLQRDSSGKIRIDVPLRSPSCDSYSRIRRVNVSEDSHMGRESRSLSLSPGAVQQLREVNSARFEDAHNQPYTIPRVVKAIGSLLADSADLQDGKNKDAHTKPYTIPRIVKAIGSVVVDSADLHDSTNKDAHTKPYTIPRVLRAIGSFLFDQSARAELLQDTKNTVGKFVSGTLVAVSESMSNLGGFVARRSQQPTRDVTAPSCDSTKDSAGKGESEQPTRDVTAPSRDSTKDSAGKGETTEFNVH
jgi:hypothetical protein